MADRMPDNGASHDSDRLQDETDDILLVALCRPTDGRGHFAEQVLVVPGEQHIQLILGNGTQLIFDATELRKAVQEA